MKKYILFFVNVFVLCFSLQAQVSINELHGDQDAHRRGIHDGNRIRTSFGNDGQIGFRGNRGTTLDYNAEWPKGEVPGYIPGYVTKFQILPMAEVRDEDGLIKHIVSENHGAGTTWDDKSRGDLAPDQVTWRTMCPLPGFVNNSIKGDSSSPALSDNSDTWPPYWPDKVHDDDDPGWRGQWNGYFGKGPSSADQESYFVADDYQNDEFKYYPDENDRNRRGLGFRMYYRYMQWANPLVEDVMFFIYELENIGTKDLDKVNFAMLPDIDCGPIWHQYDGNDDLNNFEIDEDWYYMYDEGWVEGGDFRFFHPIAYVGYALYESPGNEFDGIDNDQDGESSNPLWYRENMFPVEGLDDGEPIEVTMFNRGILSEIDTVIIIDYSTNAYTTYPRSKNTLEGLKQSDPSLFSGDTLVFDFIGRRFKFWPGTELVEIPFDNFDNNLNGLIDENNGTEVEDQGFTYIYEHHLAVNYFTGKGLNNPMIDESRKDGKDNDGDWNILDDTGVDGLDGTGDPGEGDRKPSSKYKWEGDSLVKVYDGPGEEHIDAVDVNESDMIGMTSYFSVKGDAWENYLAYNDDLMWDITKPGNISGLHQSVEVSFMGSGYFSLPAAENGNHDSEGLVSAGHRERYSGALLFNYDLDALRRVKENAQEAYDGNYQFYKAPERPTLNVVPGDGRVLLYWDSFAESSVDPLNGEDFEGYRIYRSTDKDFKDPAQISTAYGDKSLYVDPIAQYDLDNGIKGLSPGVILGVQFYLGDDTGLEHEWVDTTVVNGQRYFYAITSYDRGDAFAVPNPVSPTECTYNIDINEATGIVKSKTSNIVVVTPNSASAGYKTAPSDIPFELVEGATTSTLSLEIYDSPAIKQNNTYRVSFEDTVKLISGYNKEQLITKNVTVENVTTGDTLMEKTEKGLFGTKMPVLEGFILRLHNEGVVRVDTSKTGFEREGVYKPTFKTFYKGVLGTITADDYRIEFGDVGVDTSVAFKPDRTLLPEKAVNFTITNLTKDKKIKFAFHEQDPFLGDQDGRFTYNTGIIAYSDEIYFLEENDEGELETTWMVSMGASTNPADTTNPDVDDVLNLSTLKPMLSRDVFEFTTVAESFDKEQAKAEMKRIKVVPNPYIVTNRWEHANPYSTGRGPRELHFTHLPPKCTINIFDIAGQHVVTINRDVASTVDGTQVWDMETKDGLEIGFGIYIYHIKAPGVGEKTGKFAVIK
jgi:hypothetical protein